ncbi:MAG: MobA/MobL family protein [Verrucomicrobia bacterium]|nr:MobA/MobL family protein [Verrucomicrobiota bacterium]
MAIYRLEAKIFSREKRGRSVIAAAAYRAGSKLRDERDGKIYDYARRMKGVVNTTILTPEGAPEWALDSGRFWNAVEAGEKRVDAQLAREFILAVPPELSTEAQFATALAWARQELVSKGMVAELSLHHTKTGKNPHVHILTTMRKLEGDKFSTKKPREWNDVGLLVEQRESWAEAVNTALEKAGRPERVDHRSLKDRGIDRQPEPKIGVAATAMKRRGVEADPERFKLVRWVRALNEMRPLAKAIQRDGAVSERGVGAMWWEKSIIFAARVRDQATAWMKKSWRKMIQPSRSKGEGHEPELSR